MGKKISKMSKSELKDQISKAQKSLAKLEAELEKRIEEDQHDAVEHIDDYLEDTNVSILNLADAIKKMLAPK